MQNLLRLREEAIPSIIDRFYETRQLPSGWEAHAEETGYKVDLELVKALCARTKVSLQVEEMDPWLAPRLHAAIRIPRRVASDPRVWAWLGLHCNEFIEARFGKANKTLHPWRYQGDWDRNGLSRLWWGAEMTRNGPSYLDVSYCFKRTRTAQFALELMYSWHRPAAIAFARVAEGVGGTKLKDPQLRLLSTRLRVLLSLQCLEALGGTQHDTSEEFDEAWAQRTPTLSVLMGDLGAIEGPSTGVCDGKSISELESWFREVLAMPGGEEVLAAATVDPGEEPA